MSLEDDLLRIFGSDRISSLMDRLGMEEDIPIEHRFISKAIENAQKRVEGHNFDIRKHLLKYDDVMNQQRKVIYELRKSILTGDDLKATIAGWMDEVADEAVFAFTGEKMDPEIFDRQGLHDSLLGNFGVKINVDELDPAQGTPESILNQVSERALAMYAEKETQLGIEILRHLERVVALQNIDQKWKDHLLGMDHLKEGVSLRGYAQKDPLLEYKKEGFTMFNEMLWNVKAHTISQLLKINVTKKEDAEKIDFPKERVRPLTLSRSQKPPKPAQRVVEKVGRNDLCPCGSGKKYKKCHGS
jgi:preprotein translocase subunit SecA